MISVTDTQLLSWAGSVFFPFLRFIALTLSAPVWNHRSVPRRLRAGLALAVAVIISPLLPPVPPQAFGGSTLVLVSIHQVLIGVSIGFSIRIVLGAVEFAGELMGLQTGLGFAQFIDPALGRQQPILGAFLMLLASLVFLAIDGHLMLLSTLVETFVAYPVSVAPTQWPQPLAMVHFGAQLFSIGLQLSLPVIAAMLLTNLIFGLVARTSPALNLFAVGFPLTLTIGFWMVYQTLPSMVPVLERLLLQPHAL